MAYHTINYISVLIAAIISMIVGFFWYSPMLFGNLWMKLSGKTKKDINKVKKKGMGKIFVAEFISQLVMAYILAVIIGATGASTISQALFVSFFIWLGFIATITLGTVLWEGKSIKLYILNAAHTLISILLMGLIISLI